MFRLVRVTEAHLCPCHPDLEKTERKTKSERKSSVERKASLLASLSRASCVRESSPCIDREREGGRAGDVCCVCLCLSPAPHRRVHRLCPLAVLYLSVCSSLVLFSFSLSLSVSTALHLSMRSLCVGNPFVSYQGFFAAFASAGRRFLAQPFSVSSFPPVFLLASPRVMCRPKSLLLLLRRSPYPRLTKDRGRREGAKSTGKFCSSSLSSFLLSFFSRPLSLCRDFQRSPDACACSHPSSIDARGALPLSLSLSRHSWRAARIALSASVHLLVSLLRVERKGRLADSETSLSFEETAGAREEDTPGHARRLLY